MLEQLGMIGVSWRQGGSQSIENFTLDEASVEERLREFARAQNLSELGYLATCNRVELIYSRDGAGNGNDLRPQAFALLRGRSPMDGEAERRLRAWSGEGAAEHLFLIAAGLDSACVGETEISGQVKRCYERAREMQLSGHALDIVFEEAQRIGARVRGETRLAHGRVSLAEIAAQRLIEHTLESNQTVALIGVSPMTERAAQSLTDAGVSLLFVNRSPAKAEQLASNFHARHMSLDQFTNSPPAIGAVLSATGAPTTVLDRDALRRIADASAAGALLLIDMAIPSDIDPAASKEFGIAASGYGRDQRNCRIQSRSTARRICAGT